MGRVLGEGGVKMKIRVKGNHSLKPFPSLAAESFTGTQSGVAIRSRSKMRAHLVRRWRKMASFSLKSGSVASFSLSASRVDRRLALQQIAAAHGLMAGAHGCSK